MLIVTSKIKREEPPLHITYVHIKSIELILDADPNLKDNKGRAPIQTPHGTLEMTELLLQYGADPDVDDKGGFIPMINRYDPKFILLLVKYKANLNIKLKLLIE